MSAKSQSSSSRSSLRHLRARAHDAVGAAEHGLVAGAVENLVELVQLHHHDRTQRRGHARAGGQRLVHGADRGFLIGKGPADLRDERGVSREPGGPRLVVVAGDRDSLGAFGLLLQFVEKRTPQPLELVEGAAGLAEREAQAPLVALVGDAGGEMLDELHHAEAVAVGLDAAGTVGLHPRVGRAAEVGLGERDHAGGLGALGTGGDQLVDACPMGLGKEVHGVRAEGKHRLQ